MLAVCLVMVAGILNLSAQQTDSIKVTKQPLTADSITQIVMADTAVVLPVFADVEEERADVSSALSALTFVSIVLFAIMAAVM